MEKGGNDISVTIAGATCGSIIDMFGKPGVTTVYLHDIYPILSVKRGGEPAAGWQRFGERALVLARGEDVVCLDHEPDAAFLKYLASVGFGPAKKNIVLTSRAEGKKPYTNISRLLLEDRESRRRLQNILKETSTACINPYFPSDSCFELASFLERNQNLNLSVQMSQPSVAYKASHKDVVRDAVSRLNIPLAIGRIVRLSDVGYEGLIKAAKKVRANTGNVILRGAIGSGGKTTLLLKSNAQQIEDMLADIKMTVIPDVWLVDAWHAPLCSPNVQYYLDSDRGEVIFLTATDQRLNVKMEHIGNSWPSSAENIQQIIEAGRQVARWYLESGGAGIIGIDFVEYRCPQTSETSFFFAELNPRVNGATYPVAVVERLNRRQFESGRRPPQIRSFISGHISTHCRDFRSLVRSLDELLYDPDSSYGLFPYNLAPLSAGSFDGVACGRHRDEAVAIWDESVSRLSLTGKGD